MKVKCSRCNAYIDKDDAYRIGISSYCDWNCYIAKKKTNWSGKTSRRERSDKSMPDVVRTNILVRDGGRCKICGTRRDLEVHHIKYRSEGGTHDEDNLITLCDEHHRLVHSNKKLFKPQLELAIKNLSVGTIELDMGDEDVGR